MPVKASGSLIMRRGGCPHADPRLKIALLGPGVCVITLGLITVVGRLRPSRWWTATLIMLL